MIIIVKYYKMEPIFIVKDCKEFSKFIVKFEKKRAFPPQLFTAPKEDAKVLTDRKIKGLRL